MRAYEVSGPASPRAQLTAGKLSIVLSGRKLRGGFTLVRLARGGGRHWLRVKRRDEHAGASWTLERELTPRRPRARSRRAAAG